MKSRAREGLRGLDGAWMGGMTLGVLLLLVLFHPTGGLKGDYEVSDSQGRSVRLRSQIDPEMDFSSPQLLLSPFYQHWDLRALGVPRSLPPFEVRWTGYLRAVRPGDYLFRIETAGEARLLLDGRPLLPGPDGSAATRLDQGWHAVELEYHRAGEEPGIRLLWRTPWASEFEGVPRRYLAADASEIQRRVPLTLAGCLLLFVWTGALVHLWRARSRPRSVWESWWTHRHQLALGLAVVVGMALRFHQYDVIPFHHETADEYQHGWEGWTLLHEGMPAAWTFYPQHYPSGHVTPFLWFGDSYYLARPYFDHPPGFSLLVGAACSLLGAHDMLDCTLWRMRIVPILLGGITILMVGWVGWRILGETSGVLAALTYATLPTVVLGNRLVKAENLLALLLVAQILWLEAFLREGRRKQIAAMVGAGMVGIAAKATGIAVPAAAVLTLLKERRAKAATLVALGAGATVLAYLAYGAFFGWDLFIKVIGLQASKWVAVRTLWDLVGISRVVELQFGGGWYLFLGVAAACLTVGRHRMLLLPAAVYLAVMALTADIRAVFGWYRLPLLPFLCLAGGWFLSEWWKEKDPGRGFLFGATALANTLAYALPAPMERSRPAVLVVLGLAVLIPAWALLRPSRASRALRTWAIAGAIVVFFAGNLWIVNRQVSIYLREAGRGKATVTAGTAP